MNRKVYLTIRRLSAGGGLEKYAKRIAMGFGNTTVLTTHSDIKLPGCTIETFPLRSYFSHHKMLEFDKKCKERTQNGDIVFAMDRTSFQTHLRAGNGCHAAYLKRLPHRLTRLHKTVLHLEKEAFESPHLKRLFTNSDMVKNEILTYYNTDPEKIRVVHNGVEWFELQEAFDKRTLNKKAYHFLFVGHGFERKGLSHLIRALEGLPARLSIVGKDKRMKTYVRLAKIHNVDATFYGATSAIPLYQTADCLVIPSLYDPFANVTVEALAMGLFVISSKTNGGHEILTPENGIVYDDLRVALEKAIETSRDPQAIRNSVKHLDFSNQIPKLVNG